MTATITESPVAQELLCEDGYPIAATLYQANDSRGTIIIAPAIAATQSFYSNFARYLSSQGFDCLTFDYRGTGQSLSKEQPYDVLLEDWGKQDVETVIRFAKQRRQNCSDNHPIHLVGHSLGGQLIGLAQSSCDLDRIVHVAVSAPYWRRWPFPLSAQMLGVSRILIPFHSAFRNQFPSRRLGLGGMDVPAAVARQWARWMRYPDYLFDSRFGLDLSGYQVLEQPLLSMDFSDDDMAPESNVVYLLTKFPNARVTRRHVDVSTLEPSSVGHAGFFKARFEDSLWRETLEWLTDTNAHIQRQPRTTKEQVAEPDLAYRENI